MNSLDDLLAAAGAVPDISPEGLRDGRAAMEAASCTALGTSAEQVGRGAGAAAAATVIAMPSSPAGPADSSTGPTLIAPTTLTAAAVLDQAARAAGSQPGWPNAQYWYTEDQYTCGGQLYTDKVWLWRHGNGVVEKTGPKNNMEPVCSSDLFTVPLIDSNMFGPYTWSQLDALPTDPATLKPKLMADFGQGGGPTLFEDIEFLVEDSPAPPAVLEALFKVDASIPGVKVTGRYTDPLGRTGIALEVGREAMVVDPASGAVLDVSDGGPTPWLMYVTQGPATSEPKLGGSGTASSAGPSNAPNAGSRSRAS
jgi:hypothetical protein